MYNKCDANSPTVHLFVIFGDLAFLNQWDFPQRLRLGHIPDPLCVPDTNLKYTKISTAYTDNLLLLFLPMPFVEMKWTFLFFLHIWKLNVAYSNFLLKTQVDFESSLIQGWRLSTMQNSEVILKSKYSLFSLAHHLNDQLIEITESKVWTLFSLGEQTITVDQIKGTDHLWNTNHDLF